MRRIPWKTVYDLSPSPSGAIGDTDRSGDHMAAEEAEARRMDMSAVSRKRGAAAWVRR